MLLFTFCFYWGAWQGALHDHACVAHLSAVLFYYRILTTGRFARHPIVPRGALQGARRDICPYRVAIPMGRLATGGQLVGFTNETLAF